MKNCRLLLIVLLISLLKQISFAQNVGIGEQNPTSKLSVKGNLTVGNSYSTTTAPTNGMVVEGTLCVAE